jgi:hypothetical protein
MTRRQAMCLAVICIALYLLTGCLGTRQAEKGVVSGVISGQPVVLNWTRDTDSSVKLDIPPELISGLVSGASATPWGALIAGGASIVGAFAAAKAQANAKRADEHKADADEAWARLEAAPK